MPLFSEHIANMYYGSSSPYTGLPYSYSSSVSPIGSSYSASYLNPGGSYSSHSSLGSYSRAPIASRWITSSGRNYAPMLSTISERGSASPVRINSPRRLPLSTRTYGTPTYTPRPLNINTADIDVSRDKYRHKAEPPAPQPAQPPQPSSSDESNNSPFMPRVDGKPETGIDSSPGVERSTIKRGRTVVRLYTIKRKERDSPRKSAEELQNSDSSQDKEAQVDNVEEETKTDEKEFMKWREKLSDDLAYKDKKEKKSLGEKLVEKFILKDNNDKDSEIPAKVQKQEIVNTESIPTSPAPIPNLPGNKCLDRRCSMELMAEQANLFDSLIRSENLSTASLDLSKVGIVENKNNLETFESIKNGKPDNLHNPLKTTKSDHSLHDSIKSYKDVRDPRNFSKRRSLKKSSSGSSIRRLDSITEFPKETSNVNLPAIEELRQSMKQENVKQKPKPKLKTKITSSVEVSPPKSPLKFIVENITVEEKPCTPKKGITYSSEVEEVSVTKPLEKVTNEEVNTRKIAKSNLCDETELPSPEPDSGNFWEKIGKRETVYLMKRKQNIDQLKEKNKRALFWFPEEEEPGIPGKMNRDSHEESNTIANIISDSASLNKNETTILKMPPENNPQENSNKEKDNIIPSNTNDTKCEQHDKIQVKTMEAVKVIPEANTEKINITEHTNKIMPTLISEVKNNIESDFNVEKTAEVENILPKTKTTDVCTENIKDKMIGKSASLETINDNKVKVSSQKKTKSEKSKKSLKTDNNMALKPLQPMLPKPNIKTKVLEKSNIQNISDDVSKKPILPQNKIAIAPKVQSLANDNQETVVNVDKDSLKPKEPCPIHPFGLQELKDSNEKSDDMIEKESSKTDVQEVTMKNTTGTSDATNVPCPVHGVQKVKELKQETNNVIDSRKFTSTCSSTSKDEKNINVMQSTSEETSIKDKQSSDGDSCTQMDVKTTKIPPKANRRDSALTEKVSEFSKTDKTENETISSSNILPLVNKETLTNKISNKSQNKIEAKNTDPKGPNVNKNLKLPPKKISDVKSKEVTAKTKPSNLNQNNKVDEKVISLTSEKASTSSQTSILPETALLSNANSDSRSNNSNLQTESKLSDLPDKQVVIESRDIPNEEIESKTEINVQSEEKTGEENKAENINQKDENLEKSNQDNITPPAPKKPVKDEKPLRPLIATPRPLQKKAPQVIHSSDSSDTSSEEESSEEDDDSDSSEGSGEFFECENNPDGRTSTGSNDSGFDSSAPASPATFSQIKKDCDVNCHRKCEKLTANLCGVNQRLLVEALASRTASRKGGETSATSSSAAPAQTNNTDILEQELEQSTAYDIFRKTGRFTPPARSIPRFRKYTIEDFQFIKVLGKGSFGKVLLAELRDTEYYYAVKCLKKDVVLEDDDVECTLIERKVLALGTNHPYLCHLFATFQTDSHLFFVMEYLNGGDLMFHIQQSGRFPEARGRFYAAEIVSGLKFLHKRGIVYRDLKLDNILLDFEGHVRIADFGMCKLQIYLDKTADTFCGTPDYMAPEIIKGLKYNQTVDWWSFGVLLYEMLIGQSPFSGCDEDELFWSICNEMPSYPRFLSHEALTILTRLLDKDARTRLGGTECMHGDIREQEFFHPIHWDRLERRELEAPFRPRVRHPMDTQYFDRAFTGERPRLTAVEPHVLRSMDQEPFRGFSYTNPNTTDR